jgi:hypothetical protein
LPVGFGLLSPLPASWETSSGGGRKFAQMEIKMSNKERHARKKWKLAEVKEAAKNIN